MQSDLGRCLFNSFRRLESGLCDLDRHLDGSTDAAMADMGKLDDSFLKNLAQITRLIFL